MIVQKVAHSLHTEYNTSIQCMPASVATIQFVLFLFCRVFIVRRLMSLLSTKVMFGVPRTYGGLYRRNFRTC